MVRRIGGVMALLAGSTAAALAQGTAQSPIASSWWSATAHVIIAPWATILLLVAGCLLLFLDLLTPKTWEWMGTMGVIAVGTVFAAHVTEGTGGWVGIVLMLAGVGLLLLETHVFPGQGVAAVGGLLLLFLGMFWALGGSSHAALAFPVASVLTVVTLIAFFAYLPKSPLWKQISQQMRQQSAVGFAAAMHQNPMFLIGQSGTVLTPLRPSGVAEIAGARFDVVTEGDFLEAGETVLVTHVEEGRILVEQATAAVSAQAVGA
jgi:membrane-bound serine protease (ClpP class)